MANVLILGDPHLGGSLALGKIGSGFNYNSRITDRFNLLDWVFDQAIEHCANVIIITGDVFDEVKVSSQLMTEFISWINKCNSHSIEVEIIIGNHDIFRTGNYYTSSLDIITEAELSNCSIYKDIETIYIDNTAFTFLPFRDRKSFFTESNTEALNILQNILTYELSSIPIPFTKVAIGHFAIEGSIPVGDEIDDLTNEIFCPVDMFKGYDFVWMGHVHKPQIMSKNPYIAHIGSMDVSNLGESDHKKHIIIFDTEKSNFEKIEIPTRNIFKIVISIPSVVEDTTKYVLNEINTNKNEFKNSIVRLEVALSSSDLKPINRREIENFIYNKGVFNISGFSETKKISIIKKQANSVQNINTTTDVLAAIKMWADKKWSDPSDPKKLKFIEAAVKVYTDFKAGEKN